MKAYGSRRGRKDGVANGVTVEVETTREKRRMYNALYVLYAISLHG